MANNRRIAQRLFGAATLFLAPAIFGGQSLATEPGLTVAISPDIPPYVMKRATSGLEVDLLRAALPGYRLKFVQLPYAQLQTAIQQKKADVSVGVRKGINPEDSQQYFSDEFVDFDNYAISKDSADLSIDSVADLKGHKILTWQEAYLELGDAFKQMYSPGTSERKNYLEFANQREQVEAFWKADDAVCVIDGTIFRYFSDEMGHDNDEADFHDIFPPTTEFRVGFGDAGLRDKFNVRLKKLHDSGQYEDILERYHADPEDD
jgi:polar amino acid transport system substrate-binding protein